MLWLKNNNLSDVEDPLTKLFFAAYGLWDGICAVFIFAPVAFSGLRSTKKTA